MSAKGSTGADACGEAVRVHEAPEHEAEMAAQVGTVGEVLDAGRGGKEGGEAGRQVEAARRVGRPRGGPRHGDNGVGPVEEAELAAGDQALAVAQEVTARAEEVGRPEQRPALEQAGRGAGHLRPRRQPADDGGGGDLSSHFRLVGRSEMTEAMASWGVAEPELRSTGYSVLNIPVHVLITAQLPRHGRHQMTTGGCNHATLRS